MKEKKRQRIMKHITVMHFCVCVIHLFDEYPLFELLLMFFFRSHFVGFFAPFFRCLLKIAK